MTYLNSTRRFTVAVAAMVLAASAGAALASPRAEVDQPPPSMSVSYAGLDLHREADARKLLARLATASRAVCEGFRDGRGVDGVTAYRTCRDNALRTSVASIGSPQLYAAYAGRPSDTIVLAKQGR